MTVEMAFDAAAQRRPACEMWTVPEAAAIIGVSESTLYTLIRADQIPELKVHRVGRQLRISKVNLERYMALVAS